MWGPSCKTACGRSRGCGDATNDGEGGIRRLRDRDARCAGTCGIGRRWVLDAPAGPVMVDPAWEEWTMTDATATLRRADRAAVTESYATDGESHGVSRVANDGRMCRATATPTELTIVCQAAPAGPGGMNLALETREVRTVGTATRRLFLMTLSKDRPVRVLWGVTLASIVMSSIGCGRPLHRALSTQPCSLPSYHTGQPVTLHASVERGAHDWLLAPDGCADAVLLDLPDPVRNGMRPDELRRDDTFRRFERLVTAERHNTERTACAGCPLYYVTAVLTGRIDIAPVGVSMFGSPSPYARFRLFVTSVTDVRATRRQ
jgi:hypothetical protein